MKKILLLRIAICLGFIGCNESLPSPLNSPVSPPSPSYYVKATIDGVDVDYTSYTLAINSGPGYTVVEGYDNRIILNADGITLNFSFQPESGVASTGAVIGTYTDSANYNYTNDSVWNPYSGSFSLQLGDTDYQHNLSLELSSGNPQVCTITAVNSMSISGTFSGIVYLDSIPKIITNGSFYVPF